MNKIVLTTINAKWIHPSLALRLLKANLGSLEDSCEIIEFALRQPLAEKVEPLLAANPRILGVSVSIWNHLATIELLKEIFKSEKPVIILGGPEVSHLPEDAEIFNYADYVIRGEGEIAFRQLCEKILAGEQAGNKFINAENVNVCEIKTAYHLYTDEDVTKKLIYVESSRGCPFNCDFCLSAVKTGSSEKNNAVREFPLEPFLAEMDTLIQRGVKTFKFLDRTFNINLNRSLQIIEFFLKKIIRDNQEGNLRHANLQFDGSVEVPRKSADPSLPFVVHFEMVPSLFPSQLNEALTRFPPGTLRLEIGIQTLNPEVAARIKLPGRERCLNPENDLKTLRFLRDKTNAIIHADLIAGLPGEDMASFGRGFDNLWSALCADNTEIQLGILKLLPGAPIACYNEEFCMRYNPLPPYEIEETSSICASDLQRIKNFARFWELIVNRGLINVENKPVFDNFLTLSDRLFAHFGRNWGISRAELMEKITCFM